MVICVCGMIGAGKSTFARGCGCTVSDADEFENKEKQLEFTLKNAEKHENICHITCFPTTEELQCFENIQVIYLWINTSFSDCRRNILNRGRGRDITDLDDTLMKNKEIMEKYCHSHIQFQIVDIFKSNERW